MISQRIARASRRSGPLRPAPGRLHRRRGASGPRPRASRCREPRGRLHRSRFRRTAPAPAPNRRCLRRRTSCRRPSVVHELVRTRSPYLASGNFALFCGVTTRHFLNPHFRTLAPYFERRWRRSLTPCVSSTPRRIVVTDAWKVLYAAYRGSGPPSAPEGCASRRDVADHFETVGQANLRNLPIAEFGFFGVVVYTRVHTPRFCGQDSKCCDLDILTFASRGLRISCWIVGIHVPRVALSILAPDPGALLLDGILRRPQNAKTACVPFAGTTRWNSRGSGTGPDHDHFELQNPRHR